MDLQPSDTEEAMRAASEDVLRDRFPIAQARNRPAMAWQQMAEMGWFGVALPEAAGGIGMSLATEALVFAEMGRFLAPVGAIAAAVAARLAHAAGDMALAQEITGGRVRVALGIPAASGGLRILDAEGATLVTDVGEHRARIQDVPAAMTPAICLDLTMRQAVVPMPTDARLRVEASSAAAHQRLAAAAYALGCAEAARDMAIDYAKTREQFGKVIGGFQALKHMMADMAVRCSAARAQLLYAALSLDADRADAAFQIAAAKRLADSAALENGRANIQIHGGIGMTDEADAHLPLKRAHLLGFVSPATAAALLAA